MLGFAGILQPHDACALGQERYVEFAAGPEAFAVIGRGRAADLYVDSADFSGVALAARNLQADLHRVSGLSARLTDDVQRADAQMILIGTLGHSRVIDRLVAERKIDTAAIAGKWESFLIQVVSAPLPGIERALIICGSDKRGTIFGIYDLSEQMGVSPWYFWADVAIRHRDAVYVRPGRYLQGEPAVKYRGIFLNDEAPDLTNWVREKYGTAPGYPSSANYGHEFYARVFELILRLKGNLLWPAMWDNAFNEDDPENPRLSDEYGVVMGTSHQEPMLRAQKEWDRRYLDSVGHWNYATHPKLLEDFWRDGVRRNRSYESLITIGLRGANDTPMIAGPAAANKALLERIVEVQRRILSEEFHTDAATVPQVWCLYKEVMEYYEAGMRVPDDVSLLWADDNWGNLRRVPTASERQRGGGAGIYYHFDYHGGPRSYQWINSDPIPKIWEQMSLAKQYGADRIWIVNVGHLKGYELPIEFFLQLGWNTTRWKGDSSSEFTRLWSAREFGPDYAGRIAAIVSAYTRYNGRRKPELVDASTYSLEHYDEFEKVVGDYDALAKDAQQISERLPPEDRAAFYELVLFPVKASALLNEMYLAAARNALYARQRRASTSDMAERTRALFQAEMDLMDEFNHRRLGGRWDHFMDQPVIGYTGWRDPPRNSLDAIKLTELTPEPAPDLGVTAEGTDIAVDQGALKLPAIDGFNRQRRHIDVFNRGTGDFEVAARASAPWILVDRPRANVAKDERLWVSIDWSSVPAGATTGTVTVSGAHREVNIEVRVFSPKAETARALRGFVEGEGVVAIEPEHFSAKYDAGDKRWIRVEDYGRTLSGMRASGPADVRAVPGKDSPRLEYQVYLFESGTFDLYAVTSPTLNFLSGRGLQFAASVDDGPLSTIDAVPVDASGHEPAESWEQAVTNNARWVRIPLKFDKPGYHALKLWMIDPGVLVQRLILDTGGLKPSYLGPPESFHVIADGLRDP
jgi:hypothetical protein